MSKRLRQRELHEVFVDALGDALSAHSDLEARPLDLDLKPPLPGRVRLYIYNATHPPGGRTMGEHKIQLIVPGQARGERGDFDHAAGRYVLLVGYEAELGVFVFWDAALYQRFPYSCNLQVRAETIYAAYAGRVETQERRLQRGRGTEVLVAARSDHINDAVCLRMKMTLRRLVEA